MEKKNDSAEWILDADKYNPRCSKCGKSPIGYIELPKECPNCHALMNEKPKILFTPLEWLLYRRSEICRYLIRNGMIDCQDDKSGITCPFFQFRKEGKTCVDTVVENWDEAELEIEKWEKKYGAIV